MKPNLMCDAEFVAQLASQPQLRARFEVILRLASGAEGIRHADAAELRVIEDVRRLGQETLSAWAEQQLKQTTQEALSTPGVRREGKKNSAGTARSVKSR
jgi:hypothetical protein